MIEDLRRQQVELVRQKTAKMKRRRRRRLLVLIPMLLLLSVAGLVVSQIIMNRHFVTTHYYLRSEKVTTDIKLAVLSDLHNQEYGARNRDLIEAIRAEQPDLICIIGDMVNQDDGEVSSLYRLCESLGEIAPIYYTLGNHEGALMYSQLDAIPLDTELEDRGVNMLINRSVSWEKEGTTVRLIGIAIDESGYDRWAKDALEKAWNQDGYKIVLSHFPGLYESKLKDADFDLALAGHYHGGLICIPGIGGLYHPETGFFPKYWGGQYEMTKGTLIVSRGMGNHGWIPRINNRPELVMIEISPSIQEG